MLSGEPLVPETALTHWWRQNRHLPPAQQAFPRAPHGPKNFWPSFLADLCYMKCPNGFHSNTPKASSKQLIGSSSYRAGEGGTILSPEVREMKPEKPHV